MNTQTQSHQQTYKGGSLNRTQAQWVSNWLKSKGVELSSGWMDIWNMDAKMVADRYRVTAKEVVKAGNGEMR